MKRSVKRGIGKIDAKVNKVSLAQVAKQIITVRKYFFKRQKK